MILKIYSKLLLYAVSHDRIKLFNFLCSFNKLQNAYMEKELDQLPLSDIPGLTAEQYRRIYANIQKKV